VRKKRPAAHVNHDRWLVSYADFITLLFAFFVVLYASSQVDKRKAGHLAEAIKVAFQELGAFNASNAKTSGQGGRAVPIEDTQDVENDKLAAELGNIISPGKEKLAGAAETQSLKDAQQEIQKALNPEIERHEVSMSMRPDGLAISLKEIGFFDSGTATIRPDALDAISRLAAVLKLRPENLRIEGHTDNVPIHNSRFASNWELSASRATEMIRMLITQYELDPGRLSASGYAEFHPIAANNTVLGRAQNRRVDIVILVPSQPVDSDAETPDAPPSPKP
jgi:chemotaxis protein MotB